jgi:hypothetical protein
MINEVQNESAARNFKALMCSGIMVAVRGYAGQSERSFLSSTEYISKRLFVTAQNYKRIAVSIHV